MALARFWQDMPLMGMLKMGIDVVSRSVANSSMRTCAPARGALSWAGCLSLLALMSSLRPPAAEDEKLENFPGWHCMHCPPPQSCTQMILL